MQPKVFTYAFSSGPLPTRKALSGRWSTGNCRRAVQWYLYAKLGIFLPPKAILLPEAYHKTGTFVYKHSPVNLRTLCEGDIIYAERIRDRRGVVAKGREAFPDTDAYLVSLHTAVYAGKGMVYHPTATTGKSGLWSTRQFLHAYAPVAVKRVNGLTGYTP